MLLLTLVILSVLFLLFLAVLGVKALKRRTVSGAEGLIGLTGNVTKRLAPEGIVYVNREDYTARSRNESVIESGSKVKIISVDGIKLIVEEEKN